MSTIILKTAAGRIGTLVGGLALAGVAWVGLGGSMRAAPPVPEAETCLPTCSTTDARFLVVAGDDPTTLGATDISLGLSYEVASGEPDLNFQLFDGDRSNTNWDAPYVAPDLSTTPAPELILELYADPTGGAGALGALLATWTPGAVAGGLEQGALTMVNNGFKLVTFPHDAGALDGNGNRRYQLRLRPYQPATNQGWNAFKIKANGTVSLLGNQIVGFIGAMNLNDRPIIYPNYNPADINNSLVPTTYDGTWSFKTFLPSFLGDVTVFDGDMDFGNTPCDYKDSDDPDSDETNPNSAFYPTGVPSFAIPLLPAVTTAFPEGNASSGQNCSPNSGLGTRSGNPSDDSNFAVFKRVPTIIDHGIAYKLVAPDGQEFENKNPTGQREWEQFKIQKVNDADVDIPGGIKCPVGGFAETPGFDANNDDPLDDVYPASDCRTTVLPGGVWEIVLEGMDLANLNFWFFSFKVQPIPTDYSIGRLVWYDDNKNGIQDSHASIDNKECLPGVLCASEPGIPNVLVDVYDVTNGFPGTQVRTGLLTDANGVFGAGGAGDPIGTLPAGKYSIVVRQTNLDAAGPLEGWISTTGGEVSPAPNADPAAVDGGVEVGLPECTDTNVPAGCNDPTYDEWNFGYVAPAECIVTPASGGPFVGATHQIIPNPAGTPNGGVGYLTVRTTLNKERFVDNTYGTGAIGWPKGHTFANLTGSDKLQLSLYDANDVKKLEFAMDYISASAAPGAQGYKTLGVTGGDGSFIFPSGGVSNIWAVDTSLSVNFRDLTMPPLTVNSPATNALYAPPAAPYTQWIFDVWYDVTFKTDLFVDGYGYARVSGVHASPSKTGSNTEVCVYDEGSGQAPPPQAVPDFYEVTKNHDKSVGKPGVLKNDVPGTGGTMTAVLVTPLSVGTFVTGLNADGSFKFRPPTNYVGDATFTYKAQNSNGQSNIATVTIKVKK